MKNLPIGIQTFSKIRDKEKDYYYVDKTKFAFDLVNTNNVAFLSRPRRFGKSLFVDTLKELFEGNKDLFEGLYIYDKWDWEDKYPVIQIGMAASKSNRDEFEATLEYQLNKNCVKFDLSYDKSTTIKANLLSLIESVSMKYSKRVVVLIDEYDKSILDRFDNDIEREWVKAKLSDFYSSLKEQDEYIKFAFLTGVTKFNQVSIFSGLNNLVDISLKPEFGDICGYTNYDLDTVFKERLDNVDRDKLKEYYDGYNFNGS